jgi:hypothetical protein
MYLFFIDETNTNKAKDVKFFVSGGLIVPMNNLLDLHFGIKKIRDDINFDSEKVLKFTSKATKNITKDQINKAKSDVVNLCKKLNCIFVTSITLHEVIKQNNMNNAIEFGANTLIGKFNYFLEKKDSYGMVIMDRVPGNKEYKIAEEKFVYGLKLKNGKQIKLDRIISFCSHCNNSSYFNSAIDIVLGAFRYGINFQKNKSISKIMMQKIIFILAKEENDFIDGLNYRPRKALKEYAKKYKELISYIDSFKNSA